MAPTLAVQGSLVFSGLLSARLLGPDLRGYQTLATLLPGVVAAAAFLGFANALAYFTARDRATGPNLLSRSISVAALIATGAFFANVMLIWLFFRGAEPAIRSALLPSVLVAPAIIVQLLAGAHLQGMGRYRAMHTVRVAPYVLYAAGVVACFLVQARSLSLVIWAYTLAYSTIALMSVVVVGRSLRMADRSVSSVPRSAMLRFGTRGAAVSLSPIETFRADQLLVGAAMPAAELGYYSVATAFSVLPRLLTQSLGLIASTEAAYGSDIRRRESSRGFLITAALLVVSTVVVVEALLPFLISFLFGDAFMPALACSRLLLLATAALGLRRLVTDLIRGLGRPGVESIAEIASWPLLLVGAILALGAGGHEGGIQTVAAVVLAASTVSLVVALACLAHAMRPLRGPAAGGSSE